MIFFNRPVNTIKQEQSVPLMYGELILDGASFDSILELDATTLNAVEAVTGGQYYD